MNIRVLPEEVLLARLAVSRYRAWSRAWNRAVAGLFHSPAGLSDEGSATLALLTGTEPGKVERARASARDLKELLSQLAPEWLERSRAGDPRCRTSTLPGGAVGVEIPVDEDGLRQWLLNYTRNQPQLANFLTEDLEMLCQLQIAIEHAASSESILITGETGTGKGALAVAIHEMSGRATFNPINCTAIASTLIESELFGHSRGSFTGAHQKREGLLAATEDGTLFLDEVGDLALEVQPKLLRVLRERDFRQVGDTKLQRTNARFIAATNGALPQLVEKGLFREDLLQRLSACHLELPPLRERPGDIRLVAEQVLQQNNHPGTLTEPVRTLLHRHEWPGNVAELAAAMHYAAVSAGQEPIRISHLPDALVMKAYPPPGTASQILLTAQVLDDSNESQEHDTFHESLDAVLEGHLKEPPPIANNQEVDALVIAFVQLAFLWPGNKTPFTMTHMEKALIQLRTVSLLSELRQQLSASKASSGIMGTLEARLNAELEDLKGPPLLGMGIQVLVQLLGSDDPRDRFELLKWAHKFQQVVPMIVHLVQALMQNAQTTKAVEVSAITVQEPSRETYTQRPETKDWRDPGNRPVIEAALREAGGVKSRAAELLDIKSMSYMSKLIREHGLEDLCKELVKAQRASRG